MRSPPRLPAARSRNVLLAMPSDVAISRWLCLQGPGGCELIPKGPLGQASRSNGWTLQNRRDLISQPEEGLNLIQKRYVLELE